MTESQRLQYHLTRLALLLSHLENGATGYDWLSKEGSDKVDLSGIVDKEKRVDKYLLIRKGDDNEVRNY